MFKENRSHEMPELFSEKNLMPDNLRKRFENSWAKDFYDEVFCRIDENIFEVLFSDKYSRPNTPVNIYVSLETLKELFGLSDEELLDRFHFDNLFLFAMGLNRIGEKTISERAFYYMRRRVVEYEDRTGINLFDNVFAHLKDDYIKKLGISKKVKRIDSTLIGSNIRRLNRLKLFLEVLNCFLKGLDESNLSRLPDELREYREINTENYVFKLSNAESKLKIKEIAEYLYRVKKLFENESIKESDSYKLLERLVRDQINISANGKKIELKDMKDISSDSLQSPYDPDATYRKKGNQARQGYSATIAETCDKDNDVQVITDVIVEDNNIDDSKILEENFEDIMETETEEIIADGAYLNEHLKKETFSSEKQIITTAIRGRKPDSNKLCSTDFEIKDNKVIKCPLGKKPVSQEFTGDKIVAKFSQESCAGCTLNCIIRKNKRKENVLEIKKSRLLSDLQRQKYKDEEYIDKCRLRPAIEGTIFQVKLHLRNGKIKFRGKIKIRSRVILRAMAINFKRVHAYRLDIAAKQFILRIICFAKQLFVKEFKNSFCNV